MKISVLLIVILSSLPLHNLYAQSRKEDFEEYRQRKKGEFDLFRKNKHTEFEQYRERLNREYAKLIESSWKIFKTEPEQKPQLRPQPVKPRNIEKDKEADPGKLPIGTVIAPSPKIPDIPVTLPKVPQEIKTYPINFTFFNTHCGIGRFDTTSLVIHSTDNSYLAEAWQTLTGDNRLDPLLEDCLRLREEMRLCDWGYLLLVSKVAETLYPRLSDEQAFLSVALMNLSGYDTRLGVKGGKLVMLYHPSHTIYLKPYNVIDGKEYYIYGDVPNGALYTYDGDYRKAATPIRLVMDRYPRFTPDPETIKRYISSGWKDAPPFELAVNSSVIAFYREYPVVDWPIYGLSALSPELQGVLIQVMKVVTEGMDEIEAVNMLLKYLNYGFEYMTDGEQFGFEKSFFFDENFYYPYNDCEDRAILFGKLVNSILGLDVVYLKYPAHLATAVRFSNDTPIKGSSVEVDGYRYYVCDPTYIGSKAGQLARVFSNAIPEVYKITL